MRKTAPASAISLSLCLSLCLGLTVQAAGPATEPRGGGQGQERLASRRACVWLLASLCGFSVASLPTHVATNGGGVSLEVQGSQTQQQDSFENAFPPFSVDGFQGPWEERLEQTVGPGQVSFLLSEKEQLPLALFFPKTRTPFVLAIKSHLESEHPDNVDFPEWRESGISIPLRLLHLTNTRQGIQVSVDSGFLELQSKIPVSLDQLLSGEVLSIEMMGKDTSSSLGTATVVARFDVHYESETHSLWLDRGSATLEITAALGMQWSDRFDYRGDGVQAKYRKLIAAPETVGTFLPMVGN